MAVLEHHQAVPKPLSAPHLSLQRASTWAQKALGGSDGLNTVRGSINENAFSYSRPDLIPLRVIIVKSFRTTVSKKKTRGSARPFAACSAFIVHAAWSVCVDPARRDRLAGAHGHPRIGISISWAHCLSGDTHTLTHTHNKGLTDPGQPSSQPIIRDDLCERQLKYGNDRCARPFSNKKIHRCWLREAPPGPARRPPPAYE